MDVPRKRGRRANGSLEERQAARDAYMKEYKRTSTTIALSHEALAELQAICGEMKAKFGFRPTSSQALTWLLMERKKAERTP